jgi:hypothetical protein
MLKTYRLVSFVGRDVVCFALPLLWQMGLRRLSGEAGWTGSVAQESIRSLSGVYQAERKCYGVAVMAAILLLATAGTTLCKSPVHGVADYLSRYPANQPTADKAYHPPILLSRVLQKL